MTGMVLFIMFYRKAFQMWIAVKLVLSMVIMILMSVWLRRGVESTDSLLAAYPSLFICLLLVIAIMLSIYKPRWAKRRNPPKDQSY